MTVFVGCEPGQRYGFSAGLSGKSALLDLATPGVATVSSFQLTLKADIINLRRQNDTHLVLWRLDAVETFHGFYDPARFAESPRPRWAGVDPYGFYALCRLITPKGVISEASSVAVQAVAAVVEIPARGLLYVTSGRYGSRKWMVHTVTGAGETRESLKDYRARVLKMEGV